MTIGAVSCAADPDQDRGPIVLAASSLQGALEDAAKGWVEKGHGAPVFSFSATPALARQITGGAPADLVITADAQWMDWLEQQQMLRSDTRRNFLSNRLVVVRSVGGAITDMKNLTGNQRLALAEPESVPAGRYAKAALISLRLWDDVEPHIVPAENVRAALALVERGEAELGIVYTSDAMASDAVEIAQDLLPASYPAILYPIAITATSDHHEAQDFLAYLTSDEAQAVFAARGFEKAL